MPKNKLHGDSYFMQLALEEAMKGESSAWPNPMVGAVVVRGGKVVARGFHKKPGQPHAEVNALAGLSKSQLVNATVYVTLEPCCHLNKRTPPCANFLINSGVKRLVVAMRDPNQYVSGLGIRMLRKHGVKVKVGVLEKQARKLNERYCYVQENRSPFIALKLGMTLDAKIATSGGESKWITGPESRKHVHALRSLYDAVLTSSETVLKDNPELSVRYVKGKQPLRVILDRNLRTDPRAKVYRDKNVVVFTTDKADEKKFGLFESRGIEVVSLTDKMFTLKNISKVLYKMSVFSLMIEAGGTMAALFLKEKCIQKVYFFYAPLLLGADAKPGIGELGIQTLQRAVKLRDVSIQRFAQDFMIEASL